MADRRILFFLSALLIISSIQLGYLVTNFSPYDAPREVVWLFFLCFFAVTTSAAAFVLHSIRRKLYRTAPKELVSVRQAALISLVGTLTLLFNSLGVLTFWDIVPLLVSALLIELFFQADKRSYT